MRIECGARSDQGKVRASNEDSYIANAQNGLFVVADGMGGHAAGEVASKIAITSIEKTISSCEPGSNHQDIIELAIQEANARVFETQRLKPEFRGMGSTLTLLLFQDNQYHVAQVGDSRAYLLRNGVLNQLTQDHSIVWPLYQSGILTKEDLSRHPQKNLITRSIGTHPQVDADMQSNDALEGDIFLLCSDGLTDVLSDQDISRILSREGKSPQQLCELLVDEANAAGGPDNVTVVVIRLARNLQ